MSLPADETLRLITRDLNQTKGKMAHLDDRVTLLEQRFDKPWASLHFIDPRLIMLGLWITGGVWATVQSGQHAVAIVAASAKGLLVVDSTMGNGMKYFEPWGMWAKYLAGTGEEYWGLHWNQP